MKEILSLLWTIICICGVFYATYAVSKVMARRADGNAKTGYMQILDKMMITRDVAIYLVKIGTKAIACSVSAKSLTVIAKFSQQELESVGYEPLKAVTQNSIGNTVISFTKKVKLLFDRYTTPVHDFDSFDDVFKSKVNEDKPQSDKVLPYTLHIVSEDEIDGMMSRIEEKRNGLKSATKKVV